MEKATVYFTNELTPEAVVKMYRQLGVDLPGKVAVKVHSGEDGNQNYLRPEFMKPVIDAVNGTVVECNTAYGGARNETPKHIELMKKHHWSDLFDVDIMDAEGPDVQWPVENGKVLKVNYLGKNIENYDSMLVLIHFKGHPMGGYGGALKQLSIGCASSAGKAYIHSGGKVTDQNILWEHTAEQDTFLEAMADAASTVAKHFAGKIAYVAVMKNLSVDCDCCAVAEDPCMNDVGILSSLDPVALDRACIDLVRNSNDPGREHFMERVNSRHGTHTIDVAEALGLGTQEYELVRVYSALIKDTRQIGERLAGSWEVLGCTLNTARRKPNILPGRTSGLVRRSSRSAILTAQWTVICFHR